MAMILRIVKAISQAPCSIGRSCARLYSCLRTPVRLSQSLTEFFFDGFRVKDFFVHRCARARIVRFVIVISVLLAGFGSAEAGKRGRVEVGFKGSLTANNSQYFQNVLLNIQAVRINPHTNAGPNSGQWEHIPAPPGVGGSGHMAELQIDLNTSQNIPQLFNTSAVRADTYKVAEVKLDPNVPGYLVPNCPSAPGAPVGGFNSDGCVNVPFTVTNGPTISAPISLVAPGNGKTTELTLQLTFTITGVPTSPGAPFMVTVSTAPPTNPSSGVITGTVTVQSNSSPGTNPSNTKIRKLAVTALAIGTSTAIASSQVHNNAYTLILPAAGSPAAPGFGTLYDIAVSGGADTYQALRMPPLYPGQSLEADFKPTGSQTLGNITGSINDGCEATKPVIGATLQLLLPPDTIMSPPEGYCMASPAQTAQCITVATAFTDNSGDFPLPGTVNVPAAFANVPPAPGSTSYVMEISAPGYETLFVRVKPSSGTANKGGGTCNPAITGGSFHACDLELMKGYLTGTFPIIPPLPGQTTLVQVFAEDHGTNNIESTLPMPVSVTNTSNDVVAYTLNVPPNIPSFDLFATTVDLYRGVTDPYQGHNIVVLSDVPAPAACATATAPTPAAQTIDCTGHGSITGTVANPDLGTSVVLEKLDPDPPEGDDTAEVQLLSSIVRNQPDVDNDTPTSNYSFCAPADVAPYQVQKFELEPTPVSSMTPDAVPTPLPAGEAVSLTVPLPPPAGGPSPTPTPAIGCPTTCSYPNGQCPGICNNAAAPIL